MTKQAATTEFQDDAKYLFAKRASFRIFAPLSIVNQPLGDPQHG